MKILVTGATGFIGTLLCNKFLSLGYDVHFLSLSTDKIQNVNERLKLFYWNPSLNLIDEKCIDDVDVIVNLAGFTINCRWTKTNKKLIHQSRIDCSETLYQLLKSKQHKVKYILNASAIGIYESSEAAIYTEKDKNYGDDFLAKVCKDWEQSNSRFNKLGIDTAIARFGLVLSKTHGALYELAKVVKNGFGANLGNGKQWMSWIHHADVVGGIVFLIQNQLTGIYNFVAPKAVIQDDFLKILSIQLKKSLWLPNIPSFIIKLVLGEKSVLVLSSQQVLPQNLINKGYIFKYPTLEIALRDIYK